MERGKELVKGVAKAPEKNFEKGLVCSMCGQPAPESVDGEPSCAAHVDKIYEHQVEDYTRRHLTDHEWRKV